MLRIPATSQVPPPADLSVGTAPSGAGDSASGLAALANAQGMPPTRGIGMEKRKYRGWFLTINNPTEEIENNLKTEKYEYLAYQIEKGEEGTEHIQAVLYYKNPRVWPKKRFPTAHIEKVKSLAKSIKYCTKEDTRVRGPYTFGEVPEQGRRTDLERMTDLLREGGGKNLGEVIDVNPVEYVRYSRGLKDYAESQMKERTEAPDTVIWLWGESGVGKTHYVYSKHERSKVYLKDETEWWPGYNQQDVILIDEFDGSWPFKNFLRLLDGAPYIGNVKGGHARVNSKIIYITSDRHPKYFYEKGSDPNILAQVMRRITQIIKIERANMGNIRQPVETTWINQN